MRLLGGLGVDCCAGKSTLFNALTRTQMALSANYPFATIEPTCARVPGTQLL